MTIAKQTRELAESQAEAPASDVMSAFGREQAVLATFEPVGAIGPGAKLLEVELLDPHGLPTTLPAVLDGRRAVLVFYRGAWCPYCNIALNAYQAELLGELERRGVALVAVSPQAPDGSLNMQEKNSLRFAVLSDPGNRLAASVGILTAPSVEARAAQLQLGLDLEAINADGTTALPMPTTLILDPDLIVRWVDVHPDYTTRSEPAAILEALDALPV
ncbi:MAG TPA: peroxiredoxin-like family protein [Solirubrobacteraceae bacterium]|jgi:peroxiredoxin|nr:peroxiredoxin-like family protein [Solirubrobacteraceae bacterium]